MSKCYTSGVKFHQDDLMFEEENNGCVMLIWNQEASWVICRKEVGWAAGNCQTYRPDVKLTQGEACNIKGSFVDVLLRATIQYDVRMSSSQLECSAVVVLAVSVPQLSSVWISRFKKLVQSYGFRWKWHQHMYLWGWLKWISLYQKQKGQRIIDLFLWTFTQDGHKCGMHPMK